MRVVATVEARMGSSRFPGKILMPLAGKPSLERLVERARRAKRVDEVVIATTVNPLDDTVEAWGKKAGVSVYRGSEEDVLLRVLEAAQAHKADLLVELTGDCPLIDPSMIDALVDMYRTGRYDYCSNILKRSYPRGWDTQVFSTATLAETDRLTQDPADRENVSLYIYEHPERYRLGGMEAPPELYGPGIRICVDTADDYRMVKTVFESLYSKKPDFDANDVMFFLKENPKVAQMNAQVQQKKVRT